MALITTSGGLFPEELSNEIFSKVKGHSSLAKLCASTPIPFVGTEEMVFTMDGEVSLVSEGGNKPAGEASLGPVVIKPVKLIYQHRFTDEFMKMADEKQLKYLETFTDAFSKKMARGLDICALHGLDPATKTEDSSISAKSFDTLVTQEITYDSAAPDDNIDDAVAVIQELDGVVNGIVMAPTMGSALGKMKNSIGNHPYAEFRFGSNPASFGSLTSDINNTLSFNSSLDRAIVGDFANAFKWGYTDEVNYEVIEYGDPDGQGDLKRMNQIVLRAEAYIGWGILDAASFTKIVAASA